MSAVGLYLVKATQDLHIRLELLLRASPPRHRRQKEECQSIDNIE